MHSDWDDAPKRTRKRSGDIRLMWPVLGVAVAALVFGYRGGFENVQLDLPLRSAGLTHSSQPPLPSHELPSTADASNGSALPGLTAEELFWEQERARQQQVPTKQTSFNDSNYTPSANVNVIASIPAGSRTPQQKGQQRARPQGLTGAGTAKVLWEDARGRRTFWHTPFNYRDGKIDNATFCLSLGKGSIDYRNCRKGARSWLKDQCRSPQSMSREWRDMYCHAEGAYRT